MWKRNLWSIVVLAPICLFTIGCADPKPVVVGSEADADAIAEYERLVEESANRGGE